MRNSKLRSLAAFLMLLGTAPGVFAQRPDSVRADTARVQELEVRAVRPLLTVGGATGVRLRLDSMVALPPAPSFEQILRKLPMLHVRKNSRGEAELSARGSESRQVAVLVDGIPITLAWDSRADVSVIPSVGFQEISFVRGLSTMLHGPNVLGGVVETSVAQSTYRPTIPTADISTGFDHTGGFGGRGTVSIPLGQNRNWLIRAGGSYSDSPGAPLAKGVVEPLPASNNLRVNTDDRNVNGFAAIRYEGSGGGWFTFTGTTFKAERGIAAELGYADARYWRYPHVSRTLLALSAGTGDRRSPFGGRGDLEARIGVDLGRTEIDAYTARDYSTLDSFEDGKDRTLTVRVLGDQTLGGRADLRTALTLSEIRHDEFLPAGEARYRQRLWSVGAETIWRAIENRGKLNALRVSLGGAYDVGQTPESGGREPRQPTLSEWGARLGLTAVIADGRVLAHGGVSRRGRFPALRELYSGSLNRFTPNPDLQPENLVTLETGVTLRIGDVTEIQAAGFRHQMNDAVVRVTLPDNTFMRVNRNRLTSTGIELLASTTLGRLSLSGDLTVQSVDLTDTAAGSTSRPENLPEAFGGVSARMYLPLGLRAGSEVRYTGSQFCLDPATGNDAKLASGAIISGDISREFRLRSSGALFGRIEARVAVDNLGDKALYDQCRLPEPGRLLRFQLRVF